MQRKIGNVGQIWKFGENLEIRGKNWKCGANLEIWEKFGNLKNIRKFEEKDWIFGKNWVFLLITLSPQSSRLGCHNIKVINFITMINYHHSDNFSSP